MHNTSGFEIQFLQLAQKDKKKRRVGHEFGLYEKEQIR